MKRQPIIWGIILLFLLSSLSSIVIGFDAEKEVSFQSVDDHMDSAYPYPNVEEYHRGNMNPEWCSIFDGDVFQYTLSLDKTSDSGYILAGWTVKLNPHRTYAWLIKTDSLGNMEWNLTFGEEKDAEGYGVIESSDGGFVFTGPWEKRHDFREIFLVKTDNLGNIMWIQTYDTDNETWGNSIVEVNDGYVIVGKNRYNTWLIKTDKDGNKIWDRIYGGNEADRGRSVIETKDSGFMITGHTYSYADEDGHDIWVIKTDEEGVEQWNKTYGGNGYDRGSDIIETNDGCYMIAGGMAPIGEFWNDVCLLKIDENGNELWRKLYGGVDVDSAHSVIQLSDGSYVVAAGTQSYGLSIAGDSEAWVIKVDENGDMLWNKTFGGRERDNLLDIVEADDGGFILGGSTDSLTDGWAGAWLVKCNDYVPPKLSITKPEKNHLYLFDHKLIKSGSNTFIIGKITIDVETIDPEGRIDRVEFYVESSNGALYEHTIYTPPFSWKWDEPIGSYCYIGAAAYYSANGAHVADGLFPWMINI